VKPVNKKKIIPIHPEDHELLGFPLGDQYYFDKTLPMGLSFSCKLFETFSTAVHWIIDGPDALPAVTSFEIFCLRISKFFVADGRFLLKRNFLIPS
jgi:hypothetical protein